MPNFGHSEFLPVFFFHQNGFKQFGTPNYDCSEFLPVFLHQMVRKNSEHPVLAVPNYFQSFCTKMFQKNSECLILTILSFFQSVSLHQNGLKKMRNTIPNFFQSFCTKMVLREFRMANFGQNCA